MSQYDLFDKAEAKPLDDGEGLRSYTVGKIEEHEYKGGKRYGEVIDGNTTWFLIGKVKAEVGDQIRIKLHNYSTIEVYVNDELKWERN